MIERLQQIINGEKPEEQYDEIQEIFDKISQDIKSNKNEITLSDMAVLNKSAKFLFEPEMKELVTLRNSKFRKHLFVLATNDLTELDDFLYAASTNPGKLKDEL